MTGRRVSLCLSTLLPIVVSVHSGCAASHGADEDTGNARLAIEQVPTDVACIEVTFTGATRTVERKLEVTPGQPAVERLDGLPTGQVVVDARAYSALCATADHLMLPPTWLADPITTGISSLAEPVVTLELHPNGRVSLGADFQGDEWTVSTYLGTAGTYGTTDGTGTSALLQSPWGLAVSGNHLYVQSWPGITRDVDLGTATTTTLANEGAAANSVVLGGALYIADWWNNCITKLDLATKTWAVFAGSGLHDGAGVGGWADGTGTAARFYEPTGVTTDGTYLYVADHTATIRKIDPATAAVTTLAGSPIRGGASDGSFADARFSMQPMSITYASGKLYVGDGLNHDVRELDLAGRTVKRIVGTPGVAGSADGVGDATTLDWPAGIASDGHGSVYFVDQAAHVVRRVNVADRTLYTIAGQAFARGYADGLGRAARFSAPDGIAIDGAGNIYVSEFDNHTVRKLSRP